MEGFIYRMAKILELPQLTAKFSYELPDPQVLLVVGGDAPAASWLKEVEPGCILWSADHGVDACRAAGCPPQQLVGDADSATPEGWNWALEKGAVITKVPVEKDMTDTQLALQMIAAEYNSACVILTGCWGGRFDHAFSTIYSLQGMFKDRIWGCAVDQREALFFLHDEDSITLQFKQQPKAISLLPLSGECSGVSINGVHWPLDQVMLNNNLPYAVSNKLDSRQNTIWISQTRGLLGVYMYWEN